ncbi:MAG: GNAT family N-acetyltransferase [Promethearchaeota archaeon]
MNKTIVEVDMLHPRWDLGKIRKIYRGSFPPEERVPWSRLMREFESNRFKTDARCRISSIMLGIIDESIPDKLAGFSMLYFHQNTNFWFMAYFAIDPPSRGRGLGSRFMREVKDFCTDFSNANAGGAPAGIFYEIEKHDWKKHDVHRKKDILARYRFYSRLGQLKVDVPYVQPALAPWHPRVPMYLMFFPFEDYHDLSRAQLDSIYDTIYRCLYRKKERKLRILYKLVGKKTWPGRINLLPLDECVPFSAAGPQGSRASRSGRF